MEIKISMLLLEVKGIKEGHIFKNTPFYITLLYLVLLAHLSHWLMVSYCDRWMHVLRCPLCVMHRQQLLQRASSPKLLAGF